MDEEKANALAIYQKIGDPIMACEKLGKWFADSGMFGITKQGQGTVLALACMIEGRNPLEMARRYHIIEGNLSKKAATIQAEFQARGGRINWIERTAKVCEALFLHPEFAPKGVKIRVDIADLKHLSGKKNYQNYPRRMLHARCVSEGVTAVDPGVTVGTITPEELSDVLERPEIIDVTPEENAQQSVQHESEPGPVQSEGSAPADAPGAAQEPDPEVEHRERVERVVKAFAVYTLTQEDLEQHVGSYEDGVVVEAKDWGEIQFKQFDATLQVIKGTPAAERTAQICHMFNLPTSAMEG